MIVDCQDFCVLLRAERLAQDEKWGPVEVRRLSADKWVRIAMEELGEVARAVEEADLSGLVVESSQVAAVMSAMVEDLTRQAAEPRGGAEEAGHEDSREWAVWCAGDYPEEMPFLVRAPTAEHAAVRAHAEGYPATRKEWAIRLRGSSEEPECWLSAMEREATYSAKRIEGGER